ncbi:hypothetical protein KY329_02115 [Candidatus Woesearchaeota archaeon]|nr:hypothetical protein [Candidatus Woesearchaeota archaeon]
MDLQTLIIVIGAVLIVLLLIKLALGVAKTVVKVALILLVLVVAVMILMKAGVLPDWVDKSVDGIKDMAKNITGENNTAPPMTPAAEEKALKNISRASAARAQESGAMPEEEDSLYPPDYSQPTDQDNEVYW